MYCRERDGLLDDDEEIPGIDGRAFLDGDFGDFSLLCSLDLVLHLHGFNHNEPLAGFDFIAFRGNDAHNLPGHGGEDFSRSGLVSGRGSTAAQRARVADFCEEALRADDDVSFAEQRIFALALSVWHCVGLGSVNWGG